MANVYVTVKGIDELDCPAGTVPLKVKGTWKTGLGNDDKQHLQR